MSDKYLDLNGIERVVSKIKEYYTSVQTIRYKNIVATISSLPSLEDCEIGWMYSIRTGGTTTDDFVEGEGKPVSDGESVLVVNIGTEEEPEKKWDLVGGVFDISDRLQFGNAFPASPTIGDTFLYMGPTVLDYSEVTPVGDENPSEEGWYEYSLTVGGYVLTTDTVVDSSKTYYTRYEKYKKGIVYVYSDSDIWAPQPNGDTVSSIDSSDIENLFRS